MNLKIPLPNGSFSKYLKNFFSDHSNKDEYLLQSFKKSLRNKVASRVCLSTRHSFYYCRVPKAANSTIVMTLAYHDPDSGFDIKDKSGSKAKQNFKGFEHIKDMTKTQVLDNFFCFTFVRNPYSRVLSAYLDKTNSPKYLQKFKGKLFPEMSFKNFLLALRDELLYLDPHWAPQSAIIPFKKKELHFVGKVEELESDLEKVIEHIFGEFHGIKTRTHNQKASCAKLRDYFGPEEKELSQEIYFTDFHKFYSDEVDII